MSEICATAIRVIVWLGPGTRESQWALDLLENVWGDEFMSDPTVGDESIMAYGPNNLMRLPANQYIKGYLKEEKY